MALTFNHRLAMKFPNTFFLIFSCLVSNIAMADCTSGDCTNGFGVYTWKKSGNRYEGQHVNEDQHGQGTKYYANGDRYEGNWVKDKRDGYGKYFWKSGNRYEGNWVDGDTQGQGTRHYVNGDRYEGNWFNEQRSGEGILYNANDTIISQGIWKNDELVTSMVINLPISTNTKTNIASARDSSPPTISMSRGVSVIEVARHTIFGQAIDPSGVAMVVINGKEAALDSNGNFSASVLLAPGSNQVTIAATDVFENTSTKSFSVERKVPSGKTLPATIATTALSTGQYHALLIGVEEYASQSINDLAQPVADIKKLRDVLTENYSFDSANVRLLENPTRAQLLDELDRLTTTLNRNDNLLIFYAGHGYWDERSQQGYWLPSDAEQRRKRAWIPNGTIVDYINGIKTQHTLLISDACFSGGIFKTRSAFTSAPSATKQLYSLPSRKAMTSGTLTEVPDKSVFVEYLTRRLESNDDKYLGSQQLFTRFRTAVINNSPTQQIPQFGEIRQAGDEGGDFIFVRR